MTLYTQIHLNCRVCSRQTIGIHPIHGANGPKSTNTICGEKRKEYQAGNQKKVSENQREKSLEARRELVALTKYLKALHKAQADKAGAESEMIEVLGKTPNDLLRDHYLNSTGASELKTFRQWKDAGFYVRKGETALRVWGKPFKTKSEQVVSTMDGDQTVVSTYDRYPMVPLYSNLQVEATQDKEGKKPEAGVHSPYDFETAPCQVNSGTKVPATRLDKKVSLRNSKQANKFRDLADAMQAKVDACFASRQTNTPKRLAQAEHAKIEGNRLVRTQGLLRALAGLHETDQVPQALRSIRSKKALYSLMAAELEPVSNGFHTYYAETGRPAGSSPEILAAWALLSEKTQAQKDAEALERLVNGLQFSTIPGYFPTPETIIRRMLDQVGNLDGLHILEPNGGSAAILDYVTERNAVTTETYEVNATLVDILKRKGYSVEQRDFLTVTPKQCADIVLMNPPFEKLQDAMHVQHAFQFLKPGGTLVAIMSPSAFFLSEHHNNKAAYFREWFAELKGQKFELPQGSFKASGTGVDTVMVVVRAPHSLEQRCETLENIH